ncbi:MAG TPA: phosphoribosylformimino-5-aminoimidazole carboxamide ribotide isomerase [Methanosarcinales archaeon]|nr:phosphoribosylformimino-5-aminoimidazole carboxamide ribotide isomerase [Methanosarcinales archaeon]
MFRTILVLDIFDGIVVHAVRGMRKHYLPIAGSSLVCETSDAIEIVRALDPEEVYAADLNRIRGPEAGNNFAVIRDVSRYCRTILSCGVRSADDVPIGLAIADTVTIGTENADLNVIGQACETADASRLHVNIDLMDGKILTNTEMSLTPLEAVEKLNEYPINHLIIIDLTKVGTKSGINAGFLEETVARSNHPVIFGGGVRDMNDLDLLRDIGVAGALVATGVHNRAIPVDMLRRLRE